MKKTTEPITKIAEPRFKGDKCALVKQVEGHNIPPTTIPSCFSDPDLESGMCNPNMPLRCGEAYQCSVAKSCLVAKLASLGQSVPSDIKNKSYSEILAEADILFEGRALPASDSSTEDADRLELKAFVFSIPLKPPKNPFRADSMRRQILDILSRGWISLADLKARLLTMRADVRRLDLAISQATSIASQEAYNYRIIEIYGRYRAVER